MMDNYIIFGAGGHGNSIASAIIAQGDGISAVIDPYVTIGILHGAPVFNEWQDADINSATKFAIAIGNNAKRASIAAPVIEEFSIDRFKPVVHPTASIGLDATIGWGSVVLANATIGAYADLQEFCVVNNNAVADHDTKLGRYASLGPGALLGGCVELGAFTAIGIGAVVLEQTIIGEDVVVGANSTVLQDVGNNQMLVGTPARQVKARQHGDRYLK